MMNPRTPQTALSLRSRALLLGAAAILPLSTIHAATLVSYVGEWETGPGPFTPSYGSSVSTVNNVLYGLAPSAVGTGNFQNEAGTSAPSVLTDGTIGPITSNSIFTTVGNWQGGAGTSVTYKLTTATAISSIAVYSGWLDSGRDEQDFTFRYSTDGGLSFTNLIRVENKGNALLNITTPTAVRTVITDDTGFIANGALITDVQFNFGTDNTYPSGVENAWIGLSELAVYSAVPEPSAALLGALGALGLLRRRRA